MEKLQWDWKQEEDAFGTAHVQLLEKSSGRAFSRSHRLYLSQVYTVYRMMSHKKVEQ